MKVTCALNHVAVWMYSLPGDAAINHDRKQYNVLDCFMSFYDPSSQDYEQMSVYFFWYIQMERSPCHRKYKLWIGAEQGVNSCKHCTKTLSHESICSNKTHRLQRFKQGKRVVAIGCTCCSWGCCYCLVGLSDKELGYQPARVVQIPIMLRPNHFAGWQPCK